VIAKTNFRIESGHFVPLLSENDAGDVGGFINWWQFVIDHEAIEAEHVYRYLKPSVVDDVKNKFQYQLRNILKQ